MVIFFNTLLSGFEISPNSVFHNENSSFSWRVVLYCERWVESSIEKVLTSSFDICREFFFRGSRIDSEMLGLRKKGKKIQWNKKKHWYI